MKQEIHAFVYRNLAEIKLKKASPVQRKFIRALLETFWNPVGENVTSRKASNSVITSLLSSADVVEDEIDSKVAQLPGFEGSKIVSRRVQRVLDKANA